MKRRGIFRGFGAALAAAAAAKATPPAATDVFMARPAAMAMPGIGGFAACRMDPPSPEYRAALREISQAEERQRQLVHMLGGYPPHLVSMHSCAPWWRAQRAMAWQKREAEKSEGLLRDLQKVFSAETPGELAGGLQRVASGLGSRS